MILIRNFPYKEQVRDGVIVTSGGPAPLSAFWGIPEEGHYPSMRVIDG